MGEWLPLHAMAAQGQQPAHFDVAVLFGERNGAKELRSSEINEPQFVRKMLSCSNLIHIPEGTEKMMSYLGNKNLFVEFGSLKQRIEFLHELDFQRSLLLLDSK